LISNFLQNRLSDDFLRIYQYSIKNLIKSLIGFWARFVKHKNDCGKWPGRWQGGDARPELSAGVDKP
jgi:hypothetical protein